jgi:cytidyltransferase-like protein
MLVCLSGCFDLFHDGHKNIIENAIKYARNFGSIIIAINTDESIKRLKDDSRPIENLSTRISNIEKFIKTFNLITDYCHVDVRIISFNTEEDLFNIYKKYNPDIILHGNDLKDLSKFTGADQWPVMLIPRIKDISTTKLIEEINGADT